MKRFLLLLALLLAVGANAQPIIPANQYTTLFMTNVNAASARGYLGITGSTNILIDLAAGTGLTVTTNTPGNLSVAANTNTLATRDYVNANSGSGVTTNKLRTGNLIFLATFNQTNGVGSNVVAGATPTIGVFRHATGVGGVAPNGLLPAITNSSLTYQPISNAGTIYLCYGAEGTNPIRRVRMLARYNEVNGTGSPVNAFIHLVGNGEFVASGDLLTHGGFAHVGSQVAFDAHLGGFGSFTYGPVSATNNSQSFPLVNQILVPNIGLGSVYVYEYWLDGSNILGHVNGWPFSMPYTNGAAFGASTNLIVQFFASSGNALSARAPEILEIAAWDTPYPGQENQSQFVPFVGGTAWDLAQRGNATNMPGFIMTGTGSNAILAVTTLGVTNLNVGGTASMGAVTISNGGTLTGVFSGAGNSHVTNMTALAGTNLTISGRSAIFANGINVTGGGVTNAAGFYSGTSFLYQQFTGSNLELSAPGLTFLLRSSPAGYVFGASSVPAHFSGTVGAPSVVATNSIAVGTSNVTWTASTTRPPGNITAPPGSLHSQLSNNVTFLWLKGTNAGTDGWQVLGSPTP